MRRRKIDTRTISPRRPSLTLKENVNAYIFANSLERFTSEYLRAAIKLSVTGTSYGVINVSLEDTAYMLRLMVEYGGETSVLETSLNIDGHMTLDTYFPHGLPSIEDLSLIAKAARAAGFFFEVRGSRLICRTKITVTGRVPVYANSSDRIYLCLIDIFFSEH